MSKQIIVVGNCHIAGIAASLQWLFPSHQVTAVPFNPQVFKGDEGELARRLATADIVLGGEFVKVHMKRNAVVLDNFVSIPSLYFSAFHPDIVAAKLKSTGARIPGRYHSAIGLWAYSNRIEPADAVRLYSKDTFGMLGYLDVWDQSVARMRESFESSGLDFDRFFLAAKRDGVFMYTVNHPKSAFLTWMAKLLAIRLGQNRSVWQKEIMISDALGRVEIWPVYPDVASELSLPGSYTWFVDRGRVIDGLRDYVEYAYEKYSTSNVDPGDIRLTVSSDTLYDTVLSSALKGK